MKIAYYTAAAVLLVATAANAETATTGVGAAISNTAGAAYQKSSEGVNNVKSSYHQNMADHNAGEAKANLADGDFAAAATDAKDAAEHQSSAVDAKSKAVTAKTKASKDWSKAKAAVSTSSTTK